MSIKEQLMQILQVYSKVEGIQHKCLMHLDILKMSKNEQEAILEYGVQVQDDWLSVNGLMNFGDLHMMFDTLSVPFLLYVDKPVTTSINLNATCYRLPAKGENLVFKVWSRGYKESIVIVIVDVFDEKNSLIATSIHRLKTLKRALQPSEKL